MVLLKELASKEAEEARAAEKRAAMATEKQPAMAMEGGNDGGNKVRTGCHCNRGW